MKIFTIETDTNNITVHAAAKEAEAVAGAEKFRNQAGLAKLAANWPAARLVKIWNSLPGAERVKKFKDRNTAVERIWKAIQSLTPATPEASEAVVPEPRHAGTRSATNARRRAGSRSLEEEGHSSREGAQSGNENQEIPPGQQD